MLENSATSMAPGSGRKNKKMKIKVYSTPQCPWCRKVKEYLKDKGVEFENINVAENHEKAQEMVEKSGQMGVPVIDINGKIVLGFDKDNIDMLLEKWKGQKNGKLKAES